MAKKIPDKCKLIKDSLRVTCLLSLLIHVTCSLKGSKLILVAMDGFRYNYLDDIPVNATQNFQYFVQNGVKAKWLRNVFPTVTYPNFYTLITGLYPESHGVVHNRFYDPLWKEQFVYDNLRDNFDPIWFDVGAEPIYVTNHKAGGKSGSVLWPGGVGKVKGIGPDRIIPYQDSWSNMSFHQRVDTLLSWFTDKQNPINLGLLYFPEPDETAHKYGPGSIPVNDLITGELDDVLGYLSAQLKKFALLRDMNIILTADHGMTSFRKTVILNETLNPDWYHLASGGRNHIAVLLYPKEESYEEPIMQRLRTVQEIEVHRKNSTTMKDLHYSDHHRIAPIILIAKEGVMIFNNKSEEIKLRGKVKGMHGHNPNNVENMRPFFLAVGPAFKKGFVSEPFDSVDIYPLMCHILGIQPAPNNGSLDHVKQMLTDDQDPKYTTTAVSFLIFIALAVCVSGVFAICTCHHAGRKPRLLQLSRQGFQAVRGQESREPSRLLSDDEEDEF